MTPEATAGAPVVTGIVLAGGRSSRFGADKLAAVIDGRPLLHRAVEAVGQVADPVLVVVAPGSAPPLPPGVPARLVPDPRPFGGPLVGLAAALEAARPGRALVVGGDMPSLVPAVLERLVAGLGPGIAAATLEVPERIQPLPMALDVEAARVAVRSILARDGRSLRALLTELGAVTLPASIWRALDPDGRTILDVDRPDDLPAHPPT